MTIIWGTEENGIAPDEGEGIGSLYRPLGEYCLCGSVYVILYYNGPGMYEIILNTPWNDYTLGKHTTKTDAKKHFMRLVSASVDDDSIISDEYTISITRRKGERPQRIEDVVYDAVSGTLKKAIVDELLSASRTVHITYDKEGDYCPDWK